VKPSAFPSRIANKGESVERSSSLLVKPSAFPSRNTNKGEIIMKGEQCPTFIKLVGEAIRFSFAHRQQGRNVHQACW
jgi:hypothetical protein